MGNFRNKIFIEFKFQEFVISSGLSPRHFNFYKHFLSYSSNLYEKSIFSLRILAAFIFLFVKNRHIFSIDIRFAVKEFNCSLATASKLAFVCECVNKKKTKEKEKEKTKYNKIQKQMNKTLNNCYTKNKINSKSNEKYGKRKHLIQTSTKRSSLQKSVKNQT